MMGTMLKGGARRVYWVGMPMMEESWRNSRMKLINKIIQKAAVEHPGVRVRRRLGALRGRRRRATRRTGGWPTACTSPSKASSAWPRPCSRDIEKDWLPDGLPSPSPSPASEFLGVRQPVHLTLAGGGTRRPPAASAAVVPATRVVADHRLRR